MQTKRKIKKYLIAFVLLILSAYMAMVIKDAIDAATPEYSLPIISVSVGEKTPYVARAGYTWKFNIKKVISPYVSASDVPLVPAECKTGEDIVITFTAPVQSIILYEGDGWEDDDFHSISQWKTPDKEGVYIYRLNAEFAKGDISYFFALNIKK